MNGSLLSKRNLITVITTPVPAAEMPTSTQSVIIPNHQEDGSSHTITGGMTFELETVSLTNIEDIECKPTEIQHTNHSELDHTVPMDYNVSATHPERVQQAAEHPTDTECNLEQPTGDYTTDDQENTSPNADFKRKASDGPTLQKGVKRHASTEMKFRFFKVNWSKISDNLINRLSDLQDFRDKNATKSIPRSIQLSKTDMNSLCNLMVDQLRVIDTTISAAVMEDVAKQILDKYPGLNFIDDDGYGNGQSFVVWKHKMINRNTYLNRFKDPDVQVPSTSDIKKNRNVKAGTLKGYWKLSSQECSKDMLSKLSRNEPELLTAEFLEQSQSYVRFRLDDSDLKKTIKELPVLRRRQLLGFHFEKATGVMPGSFLSYFVAKRSKIIAYSQTARKNVQLTEASSDFDILKFLFMLLSENISDMIEHKEVLLSNYVKKK